MAASGKWRQKTCRNSVKRSARASRISLQRHPTKSIRTKVAFGMAAATSAYHRECGPIAKTPAILALRRPNAMRSLAAEAV